jgi:uncharacterized protein YdhG (YjbR/CyaY superfamily)
MAKTARKRPENIDDYVAAFPPDVQATLQRVRGSIRRALPGAEEAISYGIPAFTLNGRVVIYFAGWKQHYSIYPATARLVAALREQLDPYEVNDKGTIRFPLDAPVPVALVARIAKFRAGESAELAKARAIAAKAQTTFAKVQKAKASGQPASARRPRPRAKS